MSVNGIFDSIKLGKGKRNSFDLSHSVKLSCDMGNLIPILCEPVLPDDTFKVDSELMMRFAPMIAPIMHDVDVYVHYFFVPNRLLWDGWRDFITGGQDGKQGVDEDGRSLYPRVLIKWKDLKAGSLSDYIGYPTIEEDQIKDLDGQVPSTAQQCFFDALPLRAYNLIYNEYYRDQNVEPEVDICKDVSGVHGIRAYTSQSGSGDSDFTEAEAYERFLRIKQRAWEKDYFTSALPWTQRGETVSLPITTQVDLTDNGNINSPITGEGIANVSHVADASPIGMESVLPPAGELRSGKQVGELTRELGIGELGTADPVKLTGVAKVTVDPQSITHRISAETTSQSATINELRRSYALQRWLERNAFGGSRYIEQILAHFGVRSSDARLQRPEYLGGGKAPVRVSQVIQTSQTTTDGPDASELGSMAGHGLAIGKTNKFKKYFEEHGWVIGIMSVIPRSSYQQGMPRKFLKFDKLDYAWPEFAHLGEQGIYNKELYYNFAESMNSELSNENQDRVNNRIFGYQSRYSEYKQCPSRVCGDFKTSLSFWHLGRIFSHLPMLNNDFISTNKDDFSRIWAVNEYVDPETGEVSPITHLWVQINHRIRALRQLPYYGTPI